MTSAHDVHDLRGEIGGLRTEIRGLREEVSAGFAHVNGRVRKMEEIQIAAAAREDERAKMMAAGVIRVERPPIMRDSRTYAVGGIGTAIAMIVIEFAKAWASAPK